MLTQISQMIVVLILWCMSYKQDPYNLTALPLFILLQAVQTFVTIEILHIKMNKNMNILLVPVFEQFEMITGSLNDSYLNWP